MEIELFSNFLALLFVEVLYFVRSSLQESVVLVEAQFTKGLITIITINCGESLIAFLTKNNCAHIHGLELSKPLDKEFSLYLNICTSQDSEEFHLIFCLRYDT